MSDAQSRVVVMDLEGPKVAAWTRLARDWPIESGPAWLRAEWARITPRSYVDIATLDGSPRAAANWMVLDGDEVRGGYGVGDLLLDSHVDEALRDADAADGEQARRCSELRQRLAQLGPIRTATIAMVAAYVPGIIWDQGLEQCRQSAILRGLLARVATAARQAGASVLAVTNVPSGASFEPLRDTLRELGCVRVSMAPDCALPVPAGGIEPYIKSLRPSFRQAVRKEMRVFSSAVDRVHCCEGSRLWQDDMIDLLDARYSRYGHATDRDALRDRLLRLGKIDGMRVLVAERQGKALGFVALLQDTQGRRLIPRSCACVDNEVYAYFNLIFYELVRLAAAWGHAEVGLGSTAYRAKLLRGGRLREQSLFLLPLCGSGPPELREAADYRNLVEAERWRALTALQTDECIKP